MGEPGGASFPAAGPPRGCAERPVQTAVVFLLLFSLLLRIQDPGAREDQKLNPVATPGSIKPSLRGTRLPGRARETRGIIQGLVQGPLRAEASVAARSPGGSATG